MITKYTLMKAFRTKLGYYKTNFNIKFILIGDTKVENISRKIFRIVQI